MPSGHQLTPDDHWALWASGCFTSWHQATRFIQLVRLEQYEQTFCIKIRIRYWFFGITGQQTWLPSWCSNASLHVNTDTHTYTHYYCGYIYLIAYAHTIIWSAWVSFLKWRAFIVQGNHLFLFSLQVNITIRHCIIYIGLIYRQNSLIKNYLQWPANKLWIACLKNHFMLNIHTCTWCCVV